MKLIKSLLVVFIVLGLFVAPAPAKTPKNTLVIAEAIDDVITLDPHDVGEIGGVLTTNQVYQTLCTYDTANPENIQGVLAEKWSLADDGVTFTFTMRENAVFASGNPVTARDAEYSLHRLVKLKSRSAPIITQFGFTPENINERIKATDDRTLVIKVGEAYAPSFLLYCLSSYPGAIVDSKLVKDHEKDGDMGQAWLKAENSAGSGPYVLSMWKPKEKIVLKRNENYWGAKPAVETVILRHIAESSTQRLMLEKGDIDIANKLGPDELEAMAGNADIRIQQGLSGTIYYMGLNARNEYLAKKEVRQALKHLVDYQGIVETISRGTMEVHQTFLPRGFLGAVDANPFALDPAKAKSLLQQAGVAGEIELGMVVWNVPPYVDFAQAIQATFAQGGIKLNLEMVDGKQWLTRYRNHDLDIWLGLWGPDYPDPHSNAKAFSVNGAFSPDKNDTLADRFGWTNEELSVRAMAAVRERDTAKRHQMYQEIQKDHQQSAPFVYCFQEKRAVAMRNNVTGLVMGAMFADDRYWNTTK